MCFSFVPFQHIESSRVRCSALSMMQLEVNLLPLAKCRIEDDHRNYYTISMICIKRECYRCHCQFVVTCPVLQGTRGHSSIARWHAGMLAWERQARHGSGG